MTRWLTILLVAAVGAVPSLAQTSNKSGVDPALVARGKAIAIAADCGSCHSDPNGKSGYSGGFELAAPMGVIYVPNITPDRETGIGAWSANQFTRAVREGLSPKLGILYPAMPYPNYAGISDADMTALYAYFMHGVEPVHREVTKTALGWPYLRPFVQVWNLIFVARGDPAGADAAAGSAERGAYLVNVLGHCGACHTERGLFLQTFRTPSLAGGMVGGWYAPNITPDKSGIGEWSDAELVTYLRTGHVARRIAGGHMGEAVNLSLSQMPESDTKSIVAYLRSIPPVKTAQRAPQLNKAKPLAIVDLEKPLDGWQAYTNSDTVDGARLYQGACATCHGVDGDVPQASRRPSLVVNETVRDAVPDNLVQTILHGVNARGLAGRSLMPAFSETLSTEQIAAVASHVRNRFGGIDKPVSAADVRAIMSGTNGVSWLMLNAYWLSIAGLIAGLAIVMSIGVWFWSKRQTA